LRKIAVILFLAMLLFNWFGYRLMTAYFESKADVQLQSSLDDNSYNETDLISIKVPAQHFGYYINSKQFERVDGQIEINGLQYNYVKRRLYNDSVEYLCLPNHEATMLKTARDDFYKLVNDLQPVQGKKADSRPGSYRNFSLDYYVINNRLGINDPDRAVAKRSVHYLFHLPSVYTLTSEQPPDFC